MDVVKALGPALGIVATCAALGVARATYYRQLQPPEYGPAPKKVSPRELSAEESAAVLSILHEDRFIDLAPAEGLRDAARRRHLRLQRADDVPLAREEPGGARAPRPTAASEVRGARTVGHRAWLVADGESAALADRLSGRTTTKPRYPVCRLRRAVAAPSSAALRVSFVMGRLKK